MREQRELDENWEDDIAKRRSLWDERAEAARSESVDGVQLTRLESVDEE